LIVVPELRKRVKPHVDSVSQSIGKRVEGWKGKLTDRQRFSKFLVQETHCSHLFVHFHQFSFFVNYILAVCVWIFTCSIWLSSCLDDASSLVFIWLMENLLEGSLWIVGGCHKIVIPF
jgi:hypothetical protein